MNTDKRRSGIRIMGRLIGLVKPLLPVMLLAVVLGTIGYLCAIFLTILAGYGLMHTLLDAAMEEWDAASTELDAEKSGQTA